MNKTKPLTEADWCILLEAADVFGVAGLAKLTAQARNILDVHMGFGKVVIIFEKGKPRWMEQITNEPYPCDEMK